MDEAYEAVSWRTVFLLASLIPLGSAVHSSGTDVWIAQHVMSYLGEVPAWVLQASVAVLATLFALVMSNVGAVVLLVPMAIGIATMAQRIGMDADPRIFALTVGIAASGSFMFPTGQCNALVMGPGGYKFFDYTKVGTPLNIMVWIIATLIIPLLFPF